MRKKRVLAISAIVCAFAVTAGFAIQGHARAARYRLLLENSQMHAYREFTAAVSSLNADLQKGQYVATPVMLGVLCSDISAKAAAAQMALGELPNSSVCLEQTCAFLARTGDYARALAKQAAEAGSCTDEGRQTLAGLARASAALSTALLDLQSDVTWGGVSLEALLCAEEELAQTVGDGAAPQGGASFQTIEADFPQVPTLIYDGPFSEHLGGQTPLALEGLPQVSRDEARAVAAEFLDLPPELFSLASEGGGALPAWGFSATVDGGELYIEVTRQGGRILSVFSSRPVGEAALTPGQAVERALAFLTEQGFRPVQESYYVNQGNILTMNFAAMQGDVVCYPDLVKVSIALDDGAVVGFEAHGWLMNHTQRSLSAPVIDTAAAQAAIAPSLEVLSHQLALIPTGGQYEVLCHEFKCRTAEGGHVIVYLNAATGNEEKLLILLEDASGTLAY